MTAVESCPHCGEPQRFASLRCDHCGVDFDHCVEPPPRAWPVFLWRTFVFISIALLLFVVARGVLASQVIWEEVSLEEAVVRSPIIVLARRLDDNPIVVGSPQDQSNSALPIWAFEIIDGYKYLYRDALPQRIHVIQAYAGQDAEIKNDSLTAYSGSDFRLHYQAKKPVRLEEVGSDPVILFLTLSPGLDLSPDQPDDLYELQYLDSIEQSSERTRIKMLLRATKTE